jgi:hypothetical protein
MDDITVKINGELVALPLSVPTYSSELYRVVAAQYNVGSLQIDLWTTHDHAVHISRNSVVVSPEDLFAIAVTPTWSKKVMYEDELLCKISVCNLVGSPLLRRSFDAPIAANYQISAYGPEPQKWGACKASLEVHARVPHGGNSFFAILVPPAWLLGA